MRKIGSLVGDMCALRAPLAWQRPLCAHKFFLATANDLAFSKKKDSMVRQLKLQEQLKYKLFQQVH